MSLAVTAEAQLLILVMYVLVIHHNNLFIKTNQVSITTKQQ